MCSNHLPASTAYIEVPLVSFLTNIHFAKSTEFQSRNFQPQSPRKRWVNLLFTQLRLCTPTFPFVSSQKKKKPWIILSKDLATFETKWGNGALYLVLSFGYYVRKETKVSSQKEHFFKMLFDLVIFYAIKSNLFCFILILSLLKQLD